MLPSLSLPPLECCFGTSPIQAEKFRPDRKAFGSAMVAARAVANTGPMPGQSSSRKLISLDRCQVLCWDEPHVGAGDRLANRLCVSHVVLLSLDIGLYVSRRHQSHGMAKCLEFA